MSDLPEKQDHIILFCVPTELDARGFEARRVGFEIRDSIAIHQPEKTIFGLLGRQEPEDTVLDSVLKNGSGVLDIDAARINTTDSLDGGDTSTGKRGAGYGDRPWMKDQTVLKRRQKEAKGRVQKAEDLGRWPSNVVFTHGPECVCEGTKKVKPSNGSGVAYQDNKIKTDRVYGGALKVEGVSGNEPSAVTKNAYGEFQGRKSFNAFGNEDGTEEVPNWICQQNCPAHLLDAQSGNCVSASARYGIVEGETSFWGSSSEDVNYSSGQGDYEGGASRYFKQVQSDNELDEYLNQLIRQPTTAHNTGTSDE